MQPSAPLLAADPFLGSGSVRERLLAAAVRIIRQKGFAASSVDELCRAAGVTKGAFFHHFDSKEALGVAAADHWAMVTSELFAKAPYHAPEEPLDRLLAYIDFRAALIEGRAIEDFTCLAGTLAQEVHATSPAIRDAAGASILGHAQTLIPMIEAAKAKAGACEVDAMSLAIFTQAALQGGFILAKATGRPELALEAVAHLKRYVECQLTDHNRKERRS